MRIIAGRFKGHPLTTPKGANTRPTSDKVKVARIMRDEDETYLETS